MGCACGQREAVLFADRRVEACRACHDLTWTDAAPARVAGFRQHLRCLQEEIAEAEKEPEEERILRVAVASAAAEPPNALIVAHVQEGDPRWVAKGSVLPARVPAGGVPDAEVAVRRRHKDSLVLVADAAGWSRLAAGTILELSPRSSAQVQRTLLQAYLLVRRIDPNHGQLEDPDVIPRIPRTMPSATALTGLRPSQARAVQAALAVRDDGMLLVQGPPGTGKTTVIAALVRNLVAQRRSVLVASHTHVAIDNALRRLLQANPLLANRLVRIGDPLSVAPDMVPHAAPLGAFVEEEAPDAAPLWRSLFAQRPIVGMTLDALAHGFVRHRDMPFEPFDTVIVDEAGMNLAPKLAIARAAGRRLILVGDHEQLPPIVTAPSFRNDAAYRRSPFEALQAQRGDLCILLDEQFRCPPRLYAWSAQCVYRGKIASRRGAADGIESLLGKPLSSPVAWVDTAAIAGNADERVDGSRINRTHVAVCARIVQELVLKHGFPSEDVGLITPFRRQADLYAETARRLGWRGAQVLASTVDAFQGDERKAIVFDLTTLAPAKPHEDPRRLNVSLTRARDLLVVVGPRPFAPAPAANPWLWSLERWDVPTVIPFPKDAMDVRVRADVARVPVPRGRPARARPASR